MAEPTLSITNTGTGTSVAATAGATAGATVTLLYRIAGAVAWTSGVSRVGDGAMPQAGLVNGTRYTFILVSNGPGVRPSAPITMLVFATHTAVLELLAQEVKAKLDELIVAGIAVDVQRPTRIGIPDSPRDKSLVMYQEDPREDDGPYGSKQWVQPFTVDCYVRASDTSVAPVDTATNALRSEIEKKLMEDLTFGGYGLNATIRAAQFFPVGEGFEGVRVTVDIQYRTLELDPFTLT